MNRLRSSIFPLIVACVTVPACALDGADADSSADELRRRPGGPTAPTDPEVRDGDDDAPVRPGAPRLRHTERGLGWKRLAVQGKVLDGEDESRELDVDDDLLIVDDQEALRSAPLPAAAKRQIGDTLGQLPPDEQTGPFFINKKVADELGQRADAPRASGGSAALFGCDDVDRTYSRTFSKTTSFAYNQNDDAGNFTGNMHLSGSASGNVNANVTLRLKRVWLAGCRTYWGKVKRVHLVGTGDVVAGARVNGSFQREWHKATTVVAPTLYNDWISIGGLPVKLKVTLPVEVGVDASARVDLQANTQVNAHGNFQVTCLGTSNCTAQKDATVGFTQNGTPTASINARASVSPWVQASVRVGLYGGVAKGQLGVRATVRGDAWGYAGNTCGDGNGDGSREAVNALTFDARVALDLRARLGFFGAEKDWSWGLLDRHIGFWDLAGSSAADPIFYVGSRSGRAYTFRGQMRPCWPYNEIMRYRIEWGDGSPPEEFEEGAQSLFSRTHTFANDGIFAVRVTALEDRAGHDPGRSITRQIRVWPVADPGTGGGILVQ